MYIFEELTSLRFLCLTLSMNVWSYTDFFNFHAEGKYFDTYSIPVKIIIVVGVIKTAGNIGI